MRQITINFTAQTVVSDYALGRIGEHNATQLTITPPDALTLEPRAATYRVQFRTGSEVVTSESFATVPFTIPLWQQLTEHSRLSLQIIAYDADGEYIGKSEKLSGFYFEPSVAGNSEEADKEVKSLVHEVNENTAARHTHLNKALLDEIPAYETTDKNKSLTVGTNGLEWREAGGGSGAIEIWETGTTAKYTATELSNYADANAHFCYKGYPVINYGYQLVPREFYFTYITTRATTNMNIAQYVAKCKVTDSKTITEGTTRVIPIKVNNETANADGNITLPAPAWEDIQNKPTSFPPSAHTHAYSEITNTPDLSVYALSANLGAVATSNDYADLDNLPTIPDISGCEVTANKVTALSSASTDTQYPSAKCVYDALQGVSGWVASPTAPLDTSLLWIDTSDNTVEDLADADNTEY